MVERFSARREKNSEVRHDDMVSGVGRSEHWQRSTLRRRVGLSRVSYRQWHEFGDGPGACTGSRLERYDADEAVRTRMHLDDSGEGPARGWGLVILDQDEGAHLEVFSLCLPLGALLEVVQVFVFPPAPKMIAHIC